MFNDEMRKDLINRAGSFHASSEGEIDLRDLWEAVWKAKWIIAFTTLLFTVIAVCYAYSIPNEYKSSAILSPTNSSGSSSLASIAGQLGGLAALTGVNFNGARGADKAIIAIQLIKTWDFLEKFIQDHSLEVEVFASKGWDRSTNKLIIDQNIYDTKLGVWVRSPTLNLHDKPEPTSWKLYERIKNRIDVSQDAKSGLVTLSVEHYSPDIAKKWVELLVVAINDHMRRQDREEALNSITYLEEKIKETSVSDMKSVFYQLIEEQTKTLMLAEISNEYVLKTLSPAKVPEEKAKPDRTLIVLLAALMGGALVTFVVVVCRLALVN